MPQQLKWSEYVSQDRLPYLYAMLDYAISIGCVPSFEDAQKAYLEGAIPNPNDSAFYFGGFDWVRGELQCKLKQIPHLRPAAKPDMATANESNEDGFGQSPKFSIISSQ